MRDLLIKEICSNGILRDKRNHIEFMIDEIISLGFKVSCQTISEQSSINWSTKHIRLSLRKKPLQLFFDLAHELGHLKEQTIKSINRMDSEEVAWKYANELMEKFNLSEKEKTEFINYKVSCLKTYS